MDNACKCEEKFIDNFLVTLFANKQASGLMGRWTNANDYITSAVSGADNDINWAHMDLKENSPAIQCHWCGTAEDGSLISVIVFFPQWNTAWMWDVQPILLYHIRVHVQKLVQVYPRIKFTLYVQNIDYLFTSFHSFHALFSFPHTVVLGQRQIQGGAWGAHAPPFRRWNFFQGIWMQCSNTA